jgi:hypothetical protein
MGLANRKKQKDLFFFLLESPERFSSYIVKTIKNNV